MSDDNDQIPGGDDQAKGGAPADKGGNQTVKYETYKATVDEVKALKKKLADIEQNTTKTLEEKLKEQNDWKALAESREARLKEVTEKSANFEETIYDSLKLTAFQKHLGGKLKSEDYFSFVDLDKIVLNPETKKVEEESVKSAVAEFIKKHSALVDFGKKPGMPRDAGNGGTITPVDISKMSAKELEAHIIEQGKLGNLK